MTGKTASETHTTSQPAQLSSQMCVRRGRSKHGRGDDKAEIIDWKKWPSFRELEKLEK